MWDREIEGPGRQDIVEVKPDIMDVVIFGIVATRGGTDSLYGVRSGLSATLETDR